MTPELHALTQAEKQIEILTQQNGELHEAQATYIWQLAHALGMAGEEVADAIVQPSLLVDAIVERDEQMRELRRQLAEANAHADAVRKQPRALLMHIEAECREINTNLSAISQELENLLVALRGNYVEMDAVVAIQTHLYNVQSSSTRLAAWTQPVNGNGHKE